VTDLSAVPQWWYVCLDVGDTDAADAVVTGLLPPFLAEARALGAARWFFIRYSDESGPHLRLRLFGPGRCLDRLVRSGAELRDHLGALTDRRPPVAPRLVHPGPLLVTRGGPVGVRPALYEPEVHKYGGLAGVERAEALFEFSSELAVWAVATHRKGATRDALAALLLADAAGALAHGRTAEAWPLRSRLSWHGFWAVHTRWWTAGPGAGRDGVAQRLARHVADHGGDQLERMRTVAEDPDVDAWRRRWFRAVDHYLADAGRLGVDRTPQHLTFHHNHMLMNRLGYLPREEALLGLYARDWVSGTAPAPAAARPQRPRSRPAPVSGSSARPIHERGALP
jgi:thiopeptide-type bacteriocin biosynthesis protein